MLSVNRAFPTLPPPPCPGPGHCAINSALRRQKPPPARFPAVPHLPGARSRHPRQVAALSWDLRPLPLKLAPQGSRVGGVRPKRARERGVMWPKEPLPGGGSKLAGSPGPSGLVAECWHVAKGREAEPRPRGRKTLRAPPPAFGARRRSGEAAQLPGSLPRVRGWPPQGHWLPEPRAAGLLRGPSTARRPGQEPERDFSAASSAPCSSTGPPTSRLGDRET